jgi:hypothetical protein
MRFVLLAIGERADAKGFCFPSIADVAKRTLFTREYTGKTIEALVSEGWMSREKHPKNHRCAAFRLNLTKLSFESISCEHISNEESSCELQGDSHVNSDRVSCEQSLKPPHPLKGVTVKNRQLTPSAGANGEFMAASWLLEEMGMAGGAYDVQILAQVILYTAREGQTDAEGAATILRDLGQAARARGEPVDVFWYKGRKFTQEAGNGKAKPGVVKQRLNETRSALADALAKRGVDGPWNHHGSDDAPLAGTGERGIDGSVPGGLREAGPEILPPKVH